MDNEDWGAEYSKLADLYAVKCKEVRELQAQNKQIRADAIEEYKEQLLKDLVPLKNKYFDIARGTAMPERYTHLKRMDTVDMIIETVNLIAVQLKDNE